ncbi:MAG: tRNA (adenosine(37)-N6)-threonylcarbamoyltransferase complex transferase subunit TsaD [Gammaproteobacteria bacterium]|nr:tRNA (adenosine(37)-N6)-threonylcarbamoyltransferase complex transferase subunit TsaD [Gammaproteobacteria bacterium]
MAVLGIETSCDETAVALWDGRRLVQRLHSQIALHAAYGGVVPELAARDHVGRLNALTHAVLDEAGLSGAELQAVAYTAGPGLVGALLVGAAFAAGLAAGWRLPLVAVNHLEGHLLAPWLERPALELPLLALLVSGGHTLLVQVEAVGVYRLLGQTLDDAAGEAFDKTAKLLGLPYPGGPHLARLAERGRSGVFRLPRPMLDRPGLDFSFSGLKTAVATVLPPQPDPQARADLARAFEEAAVETLGRKCLRALKATATRRLVVAGGVGANQRLRQWLEGAAAERGFELHFPTPPLCTDNAAMIAHVGWLRRAEAMPAARGAAVRARWPLTELAPPTAAIRA